jgi:hypothetical protein
MQIAQNGDKARRCIMSVKSATKDDMESSGRTHDWMPGNILQFMLSRQPEAAEPYHADVMENGLGGA